MMYKLVFDVDGILVDILKPVEEHLHSIADGYLKTGMISADEELDGMDVLTHSEWEQLATFDIYDCVEWSFEPIPSFIVGLIKQCFNVLPRLYAESRPMHNTLVSTVNAEPLCDSVYSDVHYTGYVMTPVTSFEEWRLFFEFLLGYYDMEFHTHTYVKRNSKHRMTWMRDTLTCKGASGSMSFVVDVGKKKGIMKGDIVVEDCLANILSCEAKYRIMHAMPYNTANRGVNLQTWKDAGSPDIKVYGTFIELCDQLLRITAELHSVDFYLIKKAWWDFRVERKGK